MPLEDIDTVCPGCKTAFTTGRGLMSHIRQTSDCRRVFDGYVQLALHFQDATSSLENNPPSSPINTGMEDVGAPDEHLPRSEADVVDYDMTLEDDHDRLPGIDSNGDEVEVDFQVEIDDEDIEVTSVASTDDEDEDGEYLW